MLPDGRWHWSQGPIDLVIGADGDPAACAQAHEAAWQRFGPVLEVLVAELPLLRTRCAVDADELRASPRGEVGQRMHAACRRLAQATGLFITPMAAVAGSVADHLIGCYRAPGVRRAFINNGGDIALHLAEGERYRVGVVGNLDAPALDAAFEIDHASMLRGVASSGWRGRSLSMGIADTVTVIAADGAAADAAATLIANAVDIDDAAVVRAPACSVRDDSDLGELPVTVAVGELTPAQVDQALAAGEAFARHLLERGLIARAAITLAGRWRVVGHHSASEVLRSVLTAGASLPIVLHSPTLARESDAPGLCSYLPSSLFSIDPTTDSTRRPA
jgi:ApbE superfamily uncharacterized protein (UPF0280 family)